MTDVLRKPPAKEEQPFIVGLGGTTRTGSSSEKALRVALRHAERQGARTELFAGHDIVLPMYAPESRERDENALRLVAALRAAHGVIIASPGYHGSISGLVKNALDYTEDMRADARVYFDGMAVGCIVTAFGWQAGGSTLAALRSIAHALRGWPTPLGVIINSAQHKFGPGGNCEDADTQRNLEIMGAQIVEFARMRRLYTASGA